MERLVNLIAEEIKKCGSDLKYYMERKLLCKSVVAIKTTRFLI